MRHATPALFALLLSACATQTPQAPRPADSVERPGRPYIAAASPAAATEAALYALGLIDRNYRYGGRNPDSGLDCSGMVSHIYEAVAGLRLPHNAAQIAESTRPVEKSALQPGDLVFFNTQHRPYSHVGLYLGEGRFVHAPSSAGRYVRIESMHKPYFAARFDGARTLVPPADRPYAAADQARQQGRN
ncbi:MAG: C40 family peptidase [Rhodocyclaceae bacterium]|nr:C40 family peptidase [Rhodocyclaceae bacterium]